MIWGIVVYNLFITRRILKSSQIFYILIIVNQTPRYYRADSHCSLISQPFSDISSQAIFPITIIGFNGKTAHRVKKKLQQRRSRCEVHLHSVFDVKFYVSSNQVRYFTVGDIYIMYYISLQSKSMLSFHLYWNTRLNRILTHTKFRNVIVKEI